MPKLPLCLIGALALPLAAPMAAEPTQSPPVKTAGIAEMTGLTSEMERLSVLEGSWRVSVEQYRPKRDEWQSGETFTARFVRTIDNHFLETQLVVPQGSFGYVTDIMFSWDRFRMEYRAVIRENLVGLIDVFEGTFEGGTLALDNRETGTAGPNLNGAIEPNRLRLEIVDKGSLILHIDVWRDDQWRQGTRYRFSRLTFGAP